MKYIPLLLLFSGCGLNVHGNVDPIKVDPVTVYHIVSLDKTQLASYFHATCSLQYTDPVDIATCQQTKIDDFLAAFAASTST